MVTKKDMAMTILRALYLTLDIDLGKPVWNRRLNALMRLNREELSGQYYTAMAIIYDKRDYFHELEAKKGEKK